MRTRLLSTTLLLAVSLAGISCKEKTREQQYADESRVAAASKETATLHQFRADARQLYNNRDFAALEALAKQLRDGKERFVDGEWKIMDFYTSQDCRKDEPENMWQLHDQIHKDWEKKFPDSITARVARAQFLITYAWHARSDRTADQVTDQGWKLFRERLAEARTILDQSKALKPSCPMWFYNYQGIALGQGWERAEYDKLFTEAKELEPGFYPFDCARAKYLLPRWHGKPGEWETVAEDAIEKQGAAGPGIYARVVEDQAGYYDSIFEETGASWRKTRAGFDDLLTAHPDSKKLLNTYCRLACFAGDAPQAKKLFERIGTDEVPTAWRKGEFAEAKKWAFSQK